MTDEEREVATVEARRAAAIVAADVATLDAITDEDYVHVEANGAVRTKREFLSVLAGGERHFTRYDLNDNRIRVFFGAVAVVTGSFENAATGRDGGLTIRKARHTRVYVRRPGGWRNVSHHATAFPTPAEPAPSR